MCGIYAHLRKSKPLPPKYLHHRGPDNHGMVAFPDAVLAHTRLAIVGDATESQPFLAGDNEALTINGEIYNHAVLRQEAAPYPFHTRSDCEVVLPLLRDGGIANIARLDGVFAFVYVKDDRFIVARDAIGVVPLYYCVLPEGDVLVASERKAITGKNRSVQIFPPGHAFDGERWTRWYRAPLAPFRASTPDKDVLRALLVSAIKKRTMADVEYGVLLSGGLDSTIVATVASSLSKTRLKSFSIGLEGSPDLDHARRVAKAIGTDHHEVHFTLEEGLAALPRVVRSIETVDVTTIRASTPMWLLAQYIRKHTDVKMVLSGEGADEALCGYLYFHESPTPEAAALESAAKVEALHRFDCQRANKSMMAHGIECRVPFLDLDVLDYVMRLPGAAKAPIRGIEKHLLRRAFEGVIDDGVCWRQKEQFSDGVGYGWIDAMKALADAYPVQPTQNLFQEAPVSKEQAMIMHMFEKALPFECSTVPCDNWTPSWQKNKDPSGRASNAHTERV